MCKNSLGELKLSPLKENGKFVFLNNEIKVNGKINKDDYIKIYVDAFEAMGNKYFMKNTTVPLVRFKVRGNIIEESLPAETTSISDLYDKASEMYKNVFYFGKLEISRM
jgi:hypothetical protein